MCHVSLRLMHCFIFLHVRILCIFGAFDMSLVSHKWFEEWVVPLSKFSSLLSARVIQVGIDIMFDTMFLFRQFFLHQIDISKW